MTILSNTVRASELVAHSDDDVRLGAQALCWAVGALNTAIQIGTWFLVPWYVALLANVICTVAGFVLGTKLAASVSDESFAKAGRVIGRGLAFFKRSPKAA